MSDPLRPPVSAFKAPIVMRPNRVVTIERFILDQQGVQPEATGPLSEVLYDIALTAKLIAREVNKAGLVDILGETGDTNVHDEYVQKLDEFADDCFIKTFDHGGRLCIMASEEHDEPIPIPPKFTCGDYVLLFDPLDGSSNIDVNVTVGSIFSVYKRKNDFGGAGTMEDLLRKGSEQLAAGYVAYGSSTMLVYTTGKGVHAFTLDPGIGEFLLSEPAVQIPLPGRKIYSCNEGYRQLLFPSTRHLIDHMQTPDENGKTYSSRYVGSMVADIHRTLLYGGLFMYPATETTPNGKLRLLYEANPMALVIEQAGGMASTGSHRILDIEANDLHQRVPLYMGSKRDVELAIRFESGTD